MNVWLICIGLLVHIIFFASIFDIYFTSPLVHGMTPHATSLPPPAKRLVLFVADGLRADKFFELDGEGQSRAPYLRNVIENHGSWGVAHTRVPSESRPGHVALIAGFYEDVSAVAKGWKENPVEFDSVFNESRYTWSWGSPDILPMFAKGATGDHVFTYTYPPEMEDFADADASKVDTWVFDEVKKFITKVRTDPLLRSKVSSDKIALFLHLLGIDTNGHSHKPYSKEYLENIALVDSGIRDTVEMIEDLFDHDGKTAYIITADHGMTNWGSHGAGHPSETLTPLVAWGAGVNGPRPDNANKYTDGFTQDWQLTGLKRSDVNQADIAPLMASLIGTPFPLNSVGVLPLDYLNNTSRYKAESLLSNAQQILASYQVKEDHMRETTLGVFFSPYKALADGNKADLYRRIRQLIVKEQYQDAITLTEELIQAALDGLNYYQTYDRFFLETSIAFGYLGWMAYILQILFSHHTTLVQPRSKMDNLHSVNILTNGGLAMIFVVIAICIAVLLTVQSSPWVYYVYCLLPVPLWYGALKRYDVFQDVYRYVRNNMGVFNLCSYCILGLVATEMLVMIMFSREVISLGLLGMAFWPLCTSLRKTNKILVSGWFVACLVVAIFPMMPVVGRDVNINQVTLAGCVALLSSIAALYTCYTQTSPKPHPLQAAISICQVVLIAIAIYIVNSTWTSLHSKEGVPLMNKVISWTMLLLCFVLPSGGPQKVMMRLMSTGMSLTAVYILMSTAHEGLFCIALCYLMLLWLLCEHHLSSSASVKLYFLSFGDNTSLEQGPPRKLVLDDLRCAYFFVFFTITAFFGTGNIASINSFDPASVYCFLTVFNPFVMGALLLWKIVILFLLVTCTFQGIHLIQRLPTSSLFLVVLLLSDVMALQFFFFVQDHGSWLEIGTSISHYVIVMCMIIFVTMLLVVAHLFTTVTLPITSKVKTHKQ